MGYYANLKKISIDKFKKILKSTDLIPSRKILINNIDDIFNIIKKHNIENVDELHSVLKNINTLQDFSVKSGIQEDYLKILMREVNSYRSSPSKLKDLPGISESVLLKLENAGIKNTLQLFDKILTQQRRNEISNQTEISENEILKLAKLTDLTRIRWVNHTFAYVLYETGYDTSLKVADADYTALYEKVKTLNEERKFYKGTIGLRDIKRCVDAAKDVPPEIEY